MSAFSLPGFDLDAFVRCTLDEDLGVGLPGVYVAWALVVIALYVPCRAFARLKDRRRDWWLQYL